MSLRALLFVAVCAASFVPAARATAEDGDPSYSLADVRACSKDALRLCRDKLTQISEIESCMRSKFNELSPACQARFKGH